MSLNDILGGLRGKATEEAEELIKERFGDNAAEMADQYLGKGKSDDADSNSDDEDSSSEVDSNDPSGGDSSDDNSDDDSSDDDNSDDDDDK